MAYLDHAATTPLRPEVVDAMLPFLTGGHGNPSGGHRVAQRAKAALEEARERIAAVLGCAPGEVVLTSGGTEADNLAVKGAARAARDGGTGDGVVVSAIEHKAVLASAERLRTEGFRVGCAPVDPYGIVDADRLAGLLDEGTVLVSVMLVNNEVGVVQDLDTVAAVVREHAPRALLHTDAVQAAPWLDLRGAAAAAPLVSVTGHKIGGPVGTGALVVRPPATVRPEIEGGGQERGLRGGTNDVAGAVGFATALELTAARREAEGPRLAGLRDRLAAGLSALGGVERHGDPSRTVPGIWNGRVGGVESEELLFLLDAAGVQAAAGASCSSGAAEASHVLSAMGVEREAALESVRLSLGHTTTDADVDEALGAIAAAVARLREARKPVRPAS